MAARVRGVDSDRCSKTLHVAQHWFACYTLYHAGQPQAPATTSVDVPAVQGDVPFSPPDRGAIENWLYPAKEELPEDFEMPIWDHLEELRERVLVAALACGIAILTCFAFSKDLVVFLEAPVAAQGVRFLQLSPGEFFFTTLKVCLQLTMVDQVNTACTRITQVGGYAGLLLAAPTVLYEIIAYVVPGLTRSERQFLAPVVFGSSILFYLGYASQQPVDLATAGC